MRFGTRLCLLMWHCDLAVPGRGCIARLSLPLSGRYVITSETGVRIRTRGFLDRCPPIRNRDVERNEHRRMHLAVSFADSRSRICPRPHLRSEVSSLSGHHKSDLSGREPAQLEKERTTVFNARRQCMRCVRATRRGAPVRVCTCRQADISVQCCVQPSYRRQMGDACEGLTQDMSQGPGLAKVQARHARQLYWYSRGGERAVQLPRPQA